jgi:hypothetical protein
LHFSPGKYLYKNVCIGLDYINKQLVVVGFITEERKSINIIDQNDVAVDSSNSLFFWVQWV